MDNIQRELQEARDTNAWLRATGLETHEAMVNRQRELQEARDTIARLETQRESQVGITIIHPFINVL